MSLRRPPTDMLLCGVAMALGIAIDGPSTFHAVQTLCVGGDLSMSAIMRLHIGFLPGTSALMLLAAMACAQRIALPLPPAIRVGLCAGIALTGFALMTIAMIAGQMLAGRLAPGVSWVSAAGAFAGMTAILPLARMMPHGGGASATPVRRSPFRAYRSDAMIRLIPR